MTAAPLQTTLERFLFPPLVLPESVENKNSHTNVKSDRCPNTHFFVLLCFDDLILSEQVGHKTDRNRKNNTIYKTAKINQKGTVPIYRPLRRLRRQFPLQHRLCRRGLTPLANHRVAAAPYCSLHPPPAALANVPPPLCYAKGRSFCFLL